MILYHSECKDLFHVVRTKVVSWKMKLLSHADRVQLFHWEFVELINFRNQSCRLPIEALEDLQSISYRYIWEGKSDFTWVQMTLSKEDGGPG